MYSGNILLHITCRFEGNAGGYLGLFLGYTLLSIPEFVQNGYNWICRKYGEYQDLKRTHFIEDGDMEQGQEDEGEE